MNTGVVTEVMTLAATLFLAYPSLRLSFKLLEVKRVSGKTGASATSKDLRKMFDVWVREGDRLARSWSWLDHWCLCLGLLLVLAITLIRLIDLIAKSPTAA